VNVATIVGMLGTIFWNTSDQRYREVGESRKIVQSAPGNSKGNKGASR
jgi:hypothetical protein